jgi:glycerol-3-phosphate dehydrogenase
MKRSKLIRNITNPASCWDVIIVGGGATGLGAAVDAAARGYKTLLLEQSDFAKGTSSRSTKLVHGGVRYLAQGDIKLVREALRERGLLAQNAAHLVKNESFIIPSYRWWEKAYYTIGLTMYDLLAGKLSLGRSKPISKKTAKIRQPNLKSKGLFGGVVYQDGQFDDARLAVNLAQTCLEQGGTVLNYFKVKGLLKQDNKVAGVVAEDRLSGETYELKAKAVVNATGVFVDQLLQIDQPGKKPLVRPSQGVHLVLDKSFLQSEDAIMIPKTEDGRVLFAVPWHNKVVLGTTDTLLNEKSLEPRALEDEIEFILRTATQYLSKAPTRKDVLSVFAGLRPLAAPQDGSSKTKEISRSHKLMVSESGLITMTGGKWTTYRRMGEETIDKVIEIGQLKFRPCATEHLAIHGNAPVKDRSNSLYVYGSDRKLLNQLVTDEQALGEKLHTDYDYIKAQVVLAARNEMALTVEDVLARRMRVLFLDARAAIDMAPAVAQLLAEELGRDEAWEKEQIASFMKLANRYLLEAYYPAEVEALLA